MGRSLYEGWVASGWPMDGIAITDLDPILAVGDGQLLEKRQRNSALVVIAVKPQHVTSVIGHMRSILRVDDLVVSIAAGKALNDIEVALQGKGQAFRAMPNIAVRAMQGAIALCGTSGNHPGSTSEVLQVFSQLGHCIELDEAEFDAFTALAGSGPAFVYEFVESLTQAGITLGLDEKTAQSMSRQTLLGAAALLSETGKSPTALRDAVTSPNGTTAAGLGVLVKDGKLQKVISQTLMAAKQRSQELASGNG